MNSSTGFKLGCFLDLKNKIAENPYLQKGALLERIFTIKKIQYTKIMITGKEELLYAQEIFFNSKKQWENAGAVFAISKREVSGGFCCS